MPYCERLPVSGCTNLSNPSSHLGQSRACPLRCYRRTERSDSQPRLTRLNFQSYSRLSARFSFSCARAVCVSLRRDRAYSLRRRSSGQRRSWVVRLPLPCALLSCVSFGRLNCSPSLVPQRSKSILFNWTGGTFPRPPNCRFQVLCKSVKPRTGATLVRGFFTLTRSTPHFS